MPRFDLQFSAESQVATEIVLAGEIAKTRGIDEWSLKRIEFLHEFAYLRIFIAWESLLEDVFQRTRCGYASRAAGQERLVCGRHYPTLAAAEVAALAGNRFLLWENCSKIILRCKTHIGTPATTTTPRIPGLQETVIASHSSRLQGFAAIRHRIVHDQNDGRINFDAATKMLTGRTYPCSRPGKFLRDIDGGSSPPRKWIDTAVAELTGLAGQMV
jgi:hypothetical protein